MEVYRRYMCDFGHHWVVRTDDSEPERPEDTFCPDGHEAVTCEVEVPTREVQILIKSAARVVDQRRNQVVDDGRFWLIILDRAGKEMLRSSKHHSLNELLAMLPFLVGKDLEGVHRWWDKKKP